MLRYTRHMSNRTHRIKCIVAALAVTVGFSLPAHADSAKLDELFDKLKQADEGTYQQIESQIETEWGKSGSASMDLLLKRGNDALAAGTPEVALEHFSALVDHAPDFAEGYNGRATAYYLTNQIGPALADIRKTLALNPRHFGAMRGLAIILEEIGRENDALEVYHQVLDLDPMSTDVKDAVDRLELKLGGVAL